MTLFQFDVMQKDKRSVVLVYAQTGLAARAYLRTKFPGCDLENAKELSEETRHFVIPDEGKS